MAHLLAKTIGGLLVSVWAVFMVRPQLPQPPKQVNWPVYQSTTGVQMPQDASNQPTPTTTNPPISAGNCEAFVGMAYGIGWPAAALDTLALAMRLESGCDPHAVGDNGDSVGLLQIHQPTWCVPNKNWPVGWMQHYGLGICGDLWDAETNLRVGLAIWEGWKGSTPGWQHWHALK